MLAKKLLDRWLNDFTECPDLKVWAKELDNRCRVETFLYTNRVKVIFSDRSVATLANGKLSIKE